METLIVLILDANLCVLSHEFYEFMCVEPRILRIYVY